MIYRGAIFDLDGVLVDTVPVHFLAWKTMFESRGIPFDDAAYLAKVDGRTRQDGVRAMMPDADDRVRSTSVARTCVAAWLNRPASSGVSPRGGVR